jgi:hypothetical protein
MSISLEDIALKLTELSSIVKDYQVNLPRIIKTELDKHYNKRKAVVYGLGERDSYDVVFDIFKAYGIASTEIKVLHRLGRASLERAGPRPLVIQFSDSVVFPHLITLATIIMNHTAWNHIKVRKLETPEERHQAFLLRKERREKATAAPPPTEQVEAPCISKVTEPTSCIELSSDDEPSALMETKCNLNSSVAAEMEPEPLQCAGTGIISSRKFKVQRPADWQIQDFLSGRWVYGQNISNP